MFKKVGSWFSGLSKAGKLGVILASLFVVGAAASPSNKPTALSNPTPPAALQSAPQTKADKVENKTLTESQAIPFEKSTIQDASLESGKTAIRTLGTNGVKTLTYEVTLTNGTQTDKKLVKEEVTTAPVAEVTVIGTKVMPQPVVQAPAPTNCPNGTYTNTAGNIVCSPYQSPSAPSGATARCVDGTYSFSQSRSGTCSHHGGVAEWL